MQRDTILDNAKGILIFLVVLGHCLELSTLPYAIKLHDFIYAFHMPVFIFFAGMTSNKKDFDSYSSGILNGVIIPFVVFSFIYELLWYQKTLLPFSHFMRDFAPFWIMWFMFAMVAWKLLAPIFCQLRHPLVYSVILVFLMLWLSKGTNSLSASRILYFMPYFMLGFICGDKFYQKALSIIDGRRVVFSLISISIIAILINLINVAILYGKTSFIDMKVGMIDGALMLFITYLMFLAGIILVLSAAKILQVFNVLGQRSLYVYLWHGIVLYGLSDFIRPAIKNAETYTPSVAPLILSILLCIAFASLPAKIVTDLMNKSLRFILSKKQ